MSGIPGLNFTQDAQEVANLVFLRDSPLQYAMFRIDNEHDLVVDCKDTKDFTRTIEKSFYEFSSKLPSDSPRYVLYNFDYISPIDKIPRSRMLWIMWAPDNAPIKEKLLITMRARNAQACLLRAHAIQIQANCHEDVTIENIFANLKTKCSCI